MSTYIFTDLHGRYDLWEQIRDYLKLDDKAYFLGDAIDRGSEGIKILQELFLDDRITCLKGNHEEFLETYYYWQKNKNKDSYSQKEYLDFLYYWDSNGGGVTQEQIAFLSKQEFDDLYKKVLEMPYHLKIDNEKGQHFYLSHAGFDPWVTDDEYYRTYRMKHGLPPISNRYTWDRDHFFHPWWQPYFGRIDNEEYMDSFVIHGHTPVQYFTDWQIPKPEVHLYSKDSCYLCHKIDLDMGSFDSGRIVLFNIDTFEIIYFDRKES